MFTKSIKLYINLLVESFDSCCAS